MVQREERKPFMIYPEDPDKANWDLFITLILIFTCVATPARMAFVEVDTTGWVVVRWIIDSLFLIDIIIIFNSAFYDEDFRTIDNRKTIAKTYFSSWFFLDIFAIIPFQEIFIMTGRRNIEDGGSQENLNGVIRLAKIGRLYKLVKLTKLLRVLKIVKERSKLLKYVRELVKLGFGFERLVFITLMFFMVVHIISCLWVFFASFSDYEGTWMEGDV